MNTANLAIILSAIDKASPQINAVANSFERVKQTAEQARKAATIALGAITTAVGGATKTFMDLEKKINNVKTMSKMTFSEMEKGLLKLSSKYGKSATDLADALYDIVSAGYDGAKAMQILESSIKGATVGVSDIPTAVSATLTVLRSYGDEIKNADEVQKLMFAGVQKGRLTMQDLAQNIGEVLPIAKSFGESFKTALLTLSFGTQVFGGQADQTANRLQNLYQDLQTKSSAFEKLGIKVYDAQGKFLGLNKVMEQLYKLTEGKSTAEMNSILNSLGVSDTAQEMILAIINNFEDYKSTLEDVGNIDFESKLDEQLNTLSNSWDKLKESTINVVRIFGGAISQRMKSLIDNVNKIISGIGDWINKNKDFVASYTSTVVKILSISLGLLMIPKIIALIMSPVTWLLVGVALLAAAWTLNWDGIRDKTKEVWEKMQPWLEGLKDIMQGIITLDWNKIDIGISKLENLSKNTKTKIDDFVVDVLKVTLNFAKAVWETAKEIWEKIKSYFPEWLKSATSEESKGGKSITFGEVFSLIVNIGKIIFGTIGEKLGIDWSKVKNELDADGDGNLTFKEIIFGLIVKVSKFIVDTINQGVSWVWDKVKNVLDPDNDNQFTWNDIFSLLVNIGKVIYDLISGFIIDLKNVKDKLGNEITYKDTKSLRLMLETLYLMANALEWAKGMKAKIATWIASDAAKKSIAGKTARFILNIGKVFIIADFVWALVPDKVKNKIDEVTDDFAEWIKKNGGMLGGLKDIISGYFDNLGEDDLTVPLTIGIAWGLAPGILATLAKKISPLLKPEKLAPAINALLNPSTAGQKAVNLASGYVLATIGMALAINDIVNNTSENWQEKTLDIILAVAFGTLAGLVTVNPALGAGVFTFTMSILPKIHILSPEYFKNKNVLKDFEKFAKGTAEIDQYKKAFLENPNESTKLALSSKVAEVQELATALLQNPQTKKIISEDQLKYIEYTSEKINEMGNALYNANKRISELVEILKEFGYLQLNDIITHKYGYIPSFATGAILDRNGFIHGPGTETSDSILARVSKGEAIINARSTKKYRDLLIAINNGTLKLPGFAEGYVEQNLSYLSKFDKTLPDQIKVILETTAKHAQDTEEYKKMVDSIVSLIKMNKDMNKQIEDLKGEIQRQISELKKNTDIVKNSKTSSLGIGNFRATTEENLNPFRELIGKIILKLNDNPQTKAYYDFQKDQLGSLSQIFKGGFDILTGSIRNIGSLVADGIAKTPWAQSIANWTKKQVNSAGQAIGGAMSGAGNALGNLGSQISLGPVFDPILNGLKGIFSGITGLFGQTFGPIVQSLMSLGNVVAILNPINTIIEALMAVLGPLINGALQPFVNILKAFGQMLGTLLVPLLNPLFAGLQAFGAILTWIYNAVLVPIGRGFYVVFGMVANAFNWLYNVVSDVIRGLTFGTVNIGKRAVKSMDAIMKEANEKIAKVDMNVDQNVENSYQSQYTSTVQRSGPEVINNYINFNAPDSFILDGKQTFKEFLAETIQELYNEGQIKFA
ncbi:phage tail tape measure protein [Marinitoga sp. 1155]|uniref:phage tail tape measure protein n=1 Tax=Marinitoga sp. 1155 TaxID=1428448 RepID=UPI0006412718|nr:phage tail tape measure protein [Marinitoga sp. 1155]AJW77001.1 tail length tape measure protein [Marinitoga camini virus 2]KLO24821.1 hypothetical protein X274_02440 [Marinitoga sp. 1155]